MLCQQTSFCAVVATNVVRNTEDLLIAESTYIHLYIYSIYSIFWGGGCNLAATGVIRLGAWGGGGGVRRVGVG